MWEAARARPAPPRPLRVWAREGIPSLLSQQIFLKVAPEPLLFIRTPPPMHTQQSGGGGQPRAQLPTCHLWFAMWVLSLSGPLFPHLGNGLIVMHVLDQGGENGAQSPGAFQRCVVHRSALRI